MQKKILKPLLLLSLPVSAIIIWFIDKSINRFIFFPENLFTYIMQILGLLSIAFLTLNFILSIKSRSMEKIIGGLDDQYKLHSRFGKLALAIIIFHILNGMFRAFAGTETLKMYLVPGTNVEYNYGIIAFWMLVLLIILTISVNLPYHIWKFTHRLIIIPFILAAIHGYMSSYSNFTTPVTSFYIVVLTIIGITAFIYVEFIFTRFGPVTKYRVKSVQQIGNIVELFVEPVAQKIRYTAGQYIFLSFIKNKEITSELHPFAISTAPDEPERITAKIVGNYTETLMKAKEGDLLKLVGPFGEFYSDNFPERKVQAWVAGGIGVTPFLSMLRAEVQKDNSEQKTIYFFYCTKNESEAIYAKEIMEFAKKGKHIRVILHCSDVEGFVNAEFLKKELGSDFKDALFMVCGPTLMMTSIQKGLVKDGKKKNDIFFENFSFK